MELRPHQQIAFAAVQQAYEQGKRRALVVAPTGWGKTVLFAHLIAWDQVRHQQPVLVLAHRDELLQQAADKIRAVLPHAHIGKVGGGVQEWDAAITVASVQTVCRDCYVKALTRRNYGLAICDEAHHMGVVVDERGIPLPGKGNSYQRVVEALPDAFWLGATATPQRLDGHKITGFLGEPVYRSDIIEMIEQGWLVDIRAIAVRTQTNLDGVKKQAGDYNLKELAERIDSPQRNRRVVEAYLEHARGRQFLCFSVDVAHAQHLAEAFQQVGVNAVWVSGTTPMQERRCILKDYGKGAITGVVNCLDARTEILTRRGWVNIDTIQHDDITATFNKITQAIEWQPISRIVRRERAPEERMVHIKNQTLDIRVTEGHHMLVRAPGAHEWKTVEARTLPTRRGPYQLPLAALAPAEHQAQLTFPLATPVSSTRRQLSYISYHYRRAGINPERAKELAKSTLAHRASIRTKPVIDLTPDECRFIGLWITDGSIDRKGQRGISISQSGVYPEANQEKQRILTSCGLDWKHTAMKVSGTAFTTSPHLQHYYRIPRGVIGGQLSRKGYVHLEHYLQKDFHIDLFGLNQEQSLALIEGLWLGDGSKEAQRRAFSDPRPSYMLGKTNLVYLERVQQLAVLRGYAATLSGPKDNGPQATKPIYTLRIRRRATITTNNHTIPTSGGNPARFEQGWKPERVWCVTNANGTIITRRNGKIAIMGQCGLLTEGFDDPLGIADDGTIAYTSCIIMARPTQSQALFQQCVGRGVRLAPGKRDCLLLDLTDNVLKHSLAPQNLASALGIPTPREGETLLETVQRKKRQQHVHRFLERVTREGKRSEDVLVTLRTRLDWRAGNHGMLVLEVGTTRHRIALVPGPQPGHYEVWARLAPRFEAQLWLPASPLSWAQQYAEREARKLLSDPGAVALVDRNAAWRARNDPPTDKQVAILRKLGRPIPATKQEAFDLIGLAFAQRDAERAAQRRA
jgi:superfamily II DNA or RNA helicase